MKGAKRTGIFAAAIVLSLGLAVSAGYGAKAKKVATEVELEGRYFDADDNDLVAVGDVHANKPKCEKNRTVTVIRYDGPSAPPAEGEGDPVGDVTTDKTGDWQFTFQTNGGDTPDWITATVAAKKVKTKSGKRLKCKADAAPPVPAD